MLLSVEMAAYGQTARDKRDEEMKMQTAAKFFRAVRSAKVPIRLAPYGGDCGLGPPLMRMMPSMHCTLPGSGK